MIFNLKLYVYKSMLSGIMQVGWSPSKKKWIACTMIQWRKYLPVPLLDCGSRMIKVEKVLTVWQHSVFSPGRWLGSFGISFWIVYDQCHRGNTCPFNINSYPSSRQRFPQCFNTIQFSANWDFASNAIWSSARIFGMCLLTRVHFGLR